MRENTVAKVLKFLGLLEVIGGVIGGLSLIGDYGFIFFLAGIILCVIFYGFAEIINLLQKNWNTQEDILKILKNNNSKMSYVDKTPSNTIQDIESNLPKM